MSENPIDKLESQLETLIEGAFARLLRRTISARDIAVLLLRALEDSAARPHEDGARPTAPDGYRIQLHPDNVDQFLARYPDLPLRLARLIVNLSEESGFRLPQAPQILIIPNHQLSLVDAVITAELSSVASMPTRRMAAVKGDEDQDQLQQPTLEIIGGDIIPLDKSVISIGRETDNDLVISDAYISRHHLQLRKRRGAYTVFDVNSRGGTRVNNVIVHEHRLASGDVVCIGHTTLIYEDSAAEDIQYGTTQVMQSE